MFSCTLWPNLTKIASLTCLLLAPFCLANANGGAASGIFPVLGYAIHGSHDACTTSTCWREVWMQGRADVLNIDALDERFFTKAMECEGWPSYLIVPEGSSVIGVIPMSPAAALKYCMSNDANKENCVGLDKPGIEPCNQSTYGTEEVK